MAAATPAIGIAHLTVVPTNYRPADRIDVPRAPAESVGRPGEPDEA